MTTFLAITNNVLSRVNEVPLTSSNFSSATSFHLQAKNAVKNSINDFNRKSFEWPFNHREGTILTVPGQRTYDLPQDYKTIDLDTFFIQRDDVNNVDARRLRNIEYEEWHNNLREKDENSLQNIGTGETTVIPSFIYKTQNDKIGLSPIPDLPITVQFEYWVLPVLPSAATDDIGIPKEYDDVIIQGALYHVYMYRDNLSQANEALKEFKSGISNARSLIVNDYKYVFDTRIGRGVRRRDRRPFV